MKKHKILKRQIGAIVLAMFLAVPLFQSTLIHAQAESGDTTEKIQKETESPELNIQEEKSEMEIKEEQPEKENQNDNFGEMGEAESQDVSELSKKFGNSIPESYYHSLIVGDSSIVDLETYECEILEGVDKVEIDSDNRVSFIKPGNVQIKLTNRNAKEDTYTYDFMVSEETPEKVTYYPGHTLKLGDHINAGKKEEYLTSVVEYSQTRLGYYYGLSLETRSTFTKNFIGADVVTPFPPGKPLGERQGAKSMPAITAYRPGTLTLTSRKAKTAYEMYNTDNGELIGDAYDIVIEEPWIDTNLPQQVQVGEKLHVTTSLENTALTDMKVKDVKNGFESYGNYQLGYQPRIEIIEGEGLIKRSKGDYNNILTSSEDIEFVKEGTVTLKVIYEMLEISEGYWIKDEYMPYSPERLLTVNVVSQTDGLENSDTSEKSSSRLPLDIIQKDIDTINSAKEGSDPIVVNMGNATVVPKAILEAAKGKDVDIKFVMAGYTWTINGKNIFADALQDINLEVKFDTNAVPNYLVKELAGDNPTRQLSLTHTGDFGFRATLTMDAGKEYNGKYGNLYYYNNKNLEFMTSDKIAETGTVNLEFTHASDYVLVMSDTDMEQQNHQSEVQSVQTGDETSALPYVLSIIVCLGIVGMVIKKRYSAK